MVISKNWLKITPAGNKVYVEIRIASQTAKCKDMWLLESLRLTWELWSRLGWNSLTDNVLEKESWNRLSTETREEKITLEIDRVLKVANESDISCLLKKMASISKEIEECDLFIEACKEMERFRCLVGHTLLEGILNGMNIESEIPCDQFKGALESEIFKDTNCILQYKDSFYTQFEENAITGVLCVHFSQENLLQRQECFTNCT